MKKGRFSLYLYMISNQKRLKSNDKFYIKNWYTKQCMIHLQKLDTMLLKVEK